MAKPRLGGRPVETGAFPNEIDHSIRHYSPHVLLNKDPDAEITVFLMADAVVAARSGQKTPEGYYNVERMLKRMVVGEGRVLLCGTCMDARGMTSEDLMDGARRSTMDELATATISADKVLVF